MKPEGPNVVFILCDQMRATASHLYKTGSCPTKNLERMAREGVLFEHAFTPHPLCVPARVSLWTEEIRPHVVVDADDGLCQAVEVTNDGRAHQSARPGNEDAH